MRAVSHPEMFPYSSPRTPLSPASHVHPVHRPGQSQPPSRAGRRGYASRRAEVMAADSESRAQAIERQHIYANRKGLSELYPGITPTDLTHRITRAPQCTRLWNAKPPRGFKVDTLTSRYTASRSPAKRTTCSACVASAGDVSRAAGAKRIRRIPSSGAGRMHTWPD